MIELSYDKMEITQGGMTAELCGFGVAFFVLATGGWAIFGAAVALTFCLNSDTQKS